METSVTGEPHPVQFCCSALPVHAALQCHTTVEPYHTMEITQVTLPLQLASLIASSANSAVGSTATEARKSAPQN